MLAATKSTYCMKRTFVGAALLLSNFCVFGQTQADMNKAAMDEQTKADKQLNTVYQKILKDYKADTAFINNLKKRSVFGFNSEMPR
ncbi:MAG: DUF1311 domain-containing protein [Bacteroidota bacterium]|nr:DUF1311 domain-containing protein [Bacteroidota bacterium]